MTRLWPFLLSFVVAVPAAAAGFDLVPGDRVVLLGNTFIERDQGYGYLEAGLTLRHPGRPILFRNLGWSGDTVFGEARASFDPPAVGYRRLKEHVLALKPTVIFVGYGAVESFEGPAGLPRFREGLETLLETLAETRARILLLSPLRQEDLGRPLPDPAKHNEDLRLYRDELQQVARQRGLPFVDLFDLPDAPHSLTDDGLHLTAYGYWYLAIVIGRRLGLEPTPWSCNLDAHGANVPRREMRGTRISNVGVQRGGLVFQALDETLPFPSPPAGQRRHRHGEPGRVLRVDQLPQGRYTLKIDGIVVQSGVTAPELAKGLDLERGPEFGQAESLRAAIVKKNLLYFYRWRPQNETYLFGFRKHEQGRNAAEIVQFDPLIAEQEAAIVRLSVPVPHTYELLSEDGKVGR